MTSTPSDHRKRRTQGTVVEGIYLAATQSTVWAEWYRWLAEHEIEPRHERTERGPSELLLADLAEIGRLAGELDVRSNTDDFDVGLTTDDMAA